MSHRKIIAIQNLTQSSSLCSSARLADTFYSRLRGLLGRPELLPGTGILLTPSTGIHTLGMRFPIDVVALDRDLCVLSIAHSVEPWRIRPLSAGTRSVLEMRSGQAIRSGLSVGDRIAVQPVEPSQAA